MEIIVRQIIPEDSKEITMLSDQLGYSLSVEQTLQNINAVMKNKDLDAFVAVDKNKVIGWIGVRNAIQIESPPYSEINGLVVDENYRGNGIGKMLIEKAIQWSKEKGNVKLRLRCNVKRTETHLFYLHLGFRETKEQKVFEIKI